MVDSRSQFSVRPSAILWWSLATAVAWAGGVLQPRAGGIRSFEDFVYALSVFSVNALIVGILAGALQWVTVMRSATPFLRWTVATAAGYVLAVTVGLVLAVGIPWAGIALRGIDVAGWIYTPTPQYLILGGFMIGLIQWTVLKHLLTRASRKEASLWIIGSWAGVGLAVVVGAWFEGQVLAEASPVIYSAMAGRVVAGLVFGAVMGLLLLVLVRNHEVGDKASTADVGNL